MHVFPFLSLKKKKVTHWQPCDNLQYFHCIFYIFETHQSILRVKQEAWKILSNFSFFIHFNFTLKGKITILGKKYPIVFFNILSSENISLSHVPSYFIWSVFHWSLTLVVFCSRKQSLLSSTLCQKKGEWEGNKTVLQKHPI